MLQMNVHTLLIKCSKVTVESVLTKQANKYISGLWQRANFTNDFFHLLFSISQDTFPWALVALETYKHTR